mmetsp:Transcript_6836/g.14835  ORF Transcript_6836/g.14835 Transcript_6836/m.14835 type:complete len:339 (+) Transcript_6836:88-1104(+)
MSELHRLSEIKVSDLNENSTRWDWSSAAPSGNALQIQFMALAIINVIVATSCLLLLISILRAPNVREQSFNCYILAITFPDFIMSSMCVLTCAMSSYADTFYSEAMCGFQSWYLVWSITSNCWMNATIAHEIHKMLRISHFRGRYNPPARKRVAKEAMRVYTYAAFLASVATWNIPGVPFKSGSYRGFVCFPKDYDMASALFFWLVFSPAYMLLPMGYVAWSAIDIIWRGMIPPAGCRKTLAIFFSRIVLIFVVMWLPNFTISFIAVPALPGVSSPWINWWSCVIAHLQGLVNVIFCATKPDIKECLLDTITLGCRKKDGSGLSDDEESQKPNQNPID